MTTLTLILILPLLAAVGLAFVPRNYRFVMRLVTLATTLLVALLAVSLFWRFNADEAGYQFVTTIPFLGADALGIHCRLGVDGSRMRGHKGFRFVLVPNADHTFSTVASQGALMDVLRDHLHRLDGRGDAVRPSSTTQPARGETARIA